MDDINTLLTEFVNFIKIQIDGALECNQIKQVEINQQYFRWKLDKFEYSMESNNGFQTKQAHGDYFIKTQTIYVHNLELKLAKSPEFELLNNKLKEKFQTPDISFKFQSFLSFVIRNYLETKEINPSWLNLFIKEINNEPIKVTATVMLKGVLVEDVNPIKLSNSCMLRRITAEDIEQEFPVYPFAQVISDPLNDQVTAILEIEKNILVPIEIQNEIEKAILSLRLFRVSGVLQSRYILRGMQISQNIGGTFSSNQNITLPKETLKVFLKDAEKIKQFLYEFNQLDSSSLLKLNQTSDLGYVQFAYQRYCDSLYSTGLYEQHIASAIIGLESLYLNNESDELSRFLRLRISKFLSLAGLNPQKVQQVLKTAYGVRSCFVHGNKLDYKRLKKIQNEYASEKEFLNIVLNYLRISIIIFLNIHKQKDELIDLIDDSFIDKTKDSLLENQLKEITKKFQLIDDRV